MLGTTSLPQTLAFVPLMGIDAFASLIGLEASVVRAQVNRGYWPTVKVGKRLFVNVEAVRLKAAERGAEYAL